MRHEFDPTTLHMFVAICEERNIARAAEREAVVPSAISKRIIALESQLGVVLFKRGRRGIEMTPAGEALLRHARDILSSMERLHAEVSEFAAGLSGSIRVLASLSALSELLPDDVGAFLTKYPTVRVELDERVSPEIVRCIREGAADLGVCWRAADLRGMETLPYRSDHLCAVVPQGHPLARRKQVPFVDTLAYDHIEILSGSIMQATMRREAAVAGLALRYRVQVSTFDAACRNVAAGLGVAVVPREVAATYVPSLHLSVVPLKDRWCQRQFVICMKRRDGLTKMARLLVDYLHQAAGNTGAARATEGTVGKAK